MRVNAEPDVYQCADTHRMALGRGRALPIALQASVYPFCEMAFKGDPWPTKRQGVRADMTLV